MLAPVHRFNKILLNAYNASIFTGVPKFLERNMGVIGQQGYVELKVCNLVEAVSRTRIVCQSLE